MDTVSERAAVVLHARGEVHEVLKGPLHGTACQDLLNCGVSCCSSGPDGQHPEA